MEKWDLIPEWSFAFDRAVKRFGCRKITLSRKLTNLNKREDVRDTILHEIAHALNYQAGGKSGHGPDWKAWARKVGARPERCYYDDKITRVSAKY